MNTVTPVIADQAAIETIGHLIGGKIVLDAARTQPVYNPATGKSSKRVALASRTTVEAALSAAQAAFPGGARRPHSNARGSCSDSSNCSRPMRRA